MISFYRRKRYHCRSRKCDKIHNRSEKEAPSACGRRFKFVSDDEIVDRDLRIGIIKV